MESGALADIGHAAEERGDFATARRAFERGAALGDETCLNRLANMFDEALGVPADKEKAMRLYRQSWRRHRSTVATNNLAILCREKGDHRAMFRWYRRGAAQGDGGQFLHLAKCYLRGEGVRRSDQEALRCLARAIASDSMFECDREEAAALLAHLRPRAV